MNQTENQNQDRSWIIRYPDYSFSRPIPEADLLKMFSDGAMKPQDEIAAGNGYWFSLQDVKEMRKHFGNMPMDGLFKKVTEEITQERFAVTAPIVVPQQIRAALQAQAQAQSQAPTQAKPAASAMTDDSIQRTSPLMKALLLLLTLAVATLLFVWFG